MNDVVSFTDSLQVTGYVVLMDVEKAEEAVNSGKCGGGRGLSVAKKPSDDEAENKEAGHWLRVAVVVELEVPRPQFSPDGRRSRGGTVQSLQ